MCQDHTYPHHSYDSKLVCLTEDPVPVEIRANHQLRKIADPDKAAPDMLRRVSRENQNQVFRTGRFHWLTSY